MKTIKKVGIVPEFVEYIPEQLQEGILYISEKYGVARHLCLCGCKNDTITPLGEGSHYWGLIKENNSTVSLIGSIGNFNFPCKSHYIISKNIANFI